MFAFPNMAIDEIKDDVNLIVRFHFRSTMIGIREELEFSMPFSASYMIAFADDSTIPTHDNGSHHRIGFGILSSVFRQLQTAAHKHFVYFLLR